MTTDDHATTTTTHWQEVASRAYRHLYGPLLPDPGDAPPMTGSHATVHTGRWLPHDACAATTDMVPCPDVGQIWLVRPITQPGHTRRSRLPRKLKKRIWSCLPVPCPSQDTDPARLGRTHSAYRARRRAAQRG